MKLPPRIRVMLGVITAALLLVAGGGFAAGGQMVLAAVLLSMGLYRFVILVRQIRWLLSESADD